MVRSRSRKGENRRLKLYFGMVLDMGRAKYIDVVVDTDGETKDKYITVNFWYPIPDGVDASVEKFPNPVIAKDELSAASYFSTDSKIASLVLNKAYRPAARIIRSLGLDRSWLTCAEFTIPSPPLFICMPAAYIDGEKSPVRPLTDEEISQMLEENKDNHLFRALVADDLRNREFYEFVGGSTIGSECWVLRKYSGIRVEIKFTVPANSPILGYAMEVTRRVAVFSRNQMFRRNHWKKHSRSRGGNVGDASTEIS